MRRRQLIKSSALVSFGNLLVSAQSIWSQWLDDTATGWKSRWERNGRKREKIILSLKAFCSFKTLAVLPCETKRGVSLQFLFTVRTYSDCVHSFCKAGAGELGICAATITVILSNVSITWVSVGHCLYNSRRDETSTKVNYAKLRDKEEQYEAVHDDYSFKIC